MSEYFIGPRKEAEFLAWIEISQSIFTDEASDRSA
jgi:hypothetical protein